MWDYLRLTENSKPSINFPSVSHLHDQNKKTIIKNGINNPVIPHPDAEKKILSFDLFHTVGAGVGGQGFNTVANSDLFRARKLGELPGCGGLEFNRISHGRALQF